MGFGGLYPRPKLVATGPNSRGKNQPMPQMYVLKVFLCLFLNFATLELIKGCISIINQRKTEENLFWKKIKFHREGCVCV